MSASTGNGPKYREPAVPNLAHFVAVRTSMLVTAEAPTVLRELMFHSSQGIANTTLEETCLMQPLLIDFVVTCEAQNI